MSIFKDFFVKQKPIFTGITRGIGGFGFGSAAGGGSAPASGYAASGGTISEPGNGYVYHSFTFPNSEDFVVDDGPLSCDILIVAGGGGGGGGYYTGGGGAGGLVYGPAVTVANGTHTVTIGDGGTGSPAPGGLDSTAGTPSTFASVEALGGGRGGSGPDANDGGGSGGSGGGAPNYNPATKGDAASQPVPGNYTAYGNAGAAGAGYAGGGAGAAAALRIGGNGRPYSDFAGSLIPDLTPLVPHMGPTGDYFAGGGGGGYPEVSETNSRGGYGGGARGNPGPLNSSDGIDAVDGLGGGGGGFGNGGSPANGKGGDGGSGIVLVRYAK